LSKGECFEQLSGLLICPQVDLSDCIGQHIKRGLTGSLFIKEIIGNSLGSYRFNLL